MKPMRSILPVSLGVTLCFLSYSPLASDTGDRRVVPGELALHFASRAYINPANGTGVFAGYFTDLQGINGPMFDGAPSEATAHFTFVSDAIQFQNLPADGGVNLTILS